MKLTRVLHALYSEPWLITPAMHQQLCEIVHDHVSGAAHLAGGRAQEYDDNQKPGSVMQSSGAIARIEITGVIGRRVGEMEKSSGAVDIDDIADALIKADAAPDIDGVLMVFDSPGGTVSGVPELASLVRKVAANKPVVALASGLMASAAYWIASGASEIISEPSAQVGSIGVYQAFLDESRSFEITGKKQELFTTGKFKGIGIPGIALTDEQREEIQSRVDKIFDWFKTEININRKVPVSAMDGRVFMGDEARALDLVDLIGDENDAVNEIAGLIAVNRA